MNSLIIEPNAISLRLIGTYDSFQSTGLLGSKHAADTQLDLDARTYRASLSVCSQELLRSSIAFLH